MDDDDLRRGQPTTHRAFDEATAILAGDALQVLAFSLLARDRSPGVSYEARLRMIQILADASGHRGHGRRPGIGSLRRGAQPRSGRTRGDAQTEDRGADPGQRAARRLVCARPAALPNGMHWTAIRRTSGLPFKSRTTSSMWKATPRIWGKPSAPTRPGPSPPTPSVIGLDAAKTRARELIRRACDRLAPLQRPRPGTGLAGVLRRRSPGLDPPIHS